MSVRVTVAAVGRLKDGPERALLRRYGERIAAAGRGLGIGPLNMIEIAESRRASAPERREEEARALLAKLPSPSHLFVLDERGEALSSTAFARRLATLREAGAAHIAFVIGGPDGIGEPLRARAQQLLSLGPMTLPHGLVRVVLAEQLYRALTILSGHPYHRG